ncbi:hypothetical protein D3Y57_09795 [Sphingomonas paeninsulae]|uniref:Uncharacterized protein n=1 Tax=Sphingomonas paeninsulae TaxID=2319844 RepID=A0A494TGX4_SPHPE|nr:hypothetical protein D3Y57_09795 [Sphingomonas paeninsulae]
MFGLSLFYRQWPWTRQAYPFLPRHSYAGSDFGDLCGALGQIDLFQITCFRCVRIGGQLNAVGAGSER